MSYDYEMKKQIEELEADWISSDYPLDVEQPEPDFINELDDIATECELNDSCETDSDSGDVHIMDWD